MNVGGNANLQPDMNEFIVSARKYRPQSFNTVVGQQHITTTLKNAIKNRQLAHAFLFCGPRGVGKTTCARILAKTINCENLQGGEACNQCHSCKSFNEGTSLNIHELDAASNNSVDDIRSLVEQVRFAPQAGKYKVYIVDEVHMLSTSAFNAFLKTLEEPPPYAIFILATTEKHKILPTILSRCQIFDFKRITIQDTVDHLQEIADKETISTEKAALQLIAQKSEGCMRDALSVLDKIVSFTNGQITYQNTLEHLNILDEDYYFKLLENLLQENLAAAMLLYDEINRKGFEGDAVLNGFAMFLRNVLVCKDVQAASLLDVVEGMQERYIKAAKTVSASFLVSALNILNEAEINYKMARNKRLHVEMAIIKLNFLQQALELSFENNEVIKKKRVDAPVAYRAKTISSLQPSQQSGAQSITSPFKKEAQQPTENDYKKPEPSLVEGKVMTPQTESKLFIQQPAVPKPAFKEVKPATAPVYEPAESENNLVIAAPMTAKITEPKSKKNLLSALRDKYGDQYTIEEIDEAEPLEITRLRECWNGFAARLEEQQKHSAANTFKTAQLDIQSDTRLVITVHALVQQKFVEGEKTLLAECIQKTFHNNAIQLQIVVSDDVKEDIDPFLIMNSRERFNYIASQYPLVKELKDRLRLEIDSI